MEGKKIIVVNRDAPVPISKVTVDCDLDLCFPTRRGQTLKTVLKKFCERIETRLVAPTHWDDIEGKPDFFSGDYNDLTNKPDLGAESLFNQELIGEQNGINKVFTVAIPYSPTTTRIYLNGMRMKLGYDYFETDNTTITFDFTINSTDQLIIDYNK